jgi:hypothetical protein
MYGESQTATQPSLQRSHLPKLRFLVGAQSAPFTSFGLLVSIAIELAFPRLLPLTRKASKLSPSLQCAVAVAL